MYLNPIKSIDGAYPPLQSVRAAGLLRFPDEFVPVFYPADKRFAGFVNITDDGETVLTCEWNDEAYLAYAEAHPETEPEEPEPEISVWDELAAAYMEGVNSAYEQ